MTNGEVRAVARRVRAQLRRDLAESDPEPDERARGFLDYTRTHAEAMGLSDDVRKAISGATAAQQERPYCFPPGWSPPVDLRQWRPRARWHGGGGPGGSEMIAFSAATVADPPEHLRRFWAGPRPGRPSLC